MTKKSSTERFSEYQIMWIFVLFDLPTFTKEDRKQALDFRELLQRDGFRMLQYSVYIRHCPSRENADVHTRRVRGWLPRSGRVSIVVITDKQFSQIETFYGKVAASPEAEPQQLTLF